MSVSPDLGYDESELNDINLQPITLDDITSSCDGAVNGEREIVEWKQRDHFSSSLAIGKRKRLLTLRSENSLWNRALSKVGSVTDVWGNFDLDGINTEKALRHRYSALKATWTVDHVHVKMETDSFNAGAMRRCFRSKKLSNFAHTDSWRGESHNYVAKEYMSDVERSTYFDDVKLQMEAKLWGEEYNRHNPPKKVDIMQMCIVEMVERTGKPLFHFEHFIEGDYVKYNSNSGFVRDENMRLTPQAFSHFTFERSGHELIVVDVQGVGDLYTDPQIHTADGDSYGDGNLGTRGMALFFHSHVCSPICRGLGLTPFDLANTENTQLSQLAKRQELCKTVSRAGSISEDVPPSSPGRCAQSWDYTSPGHELLRRRQSSGCYSNEEASASNQAVSAGLGYSESAVDSARSKRVRCLSGSSTGSNETSERARFRDVIQNRQRASDVESEVVRLAEDGVVSVIPEPIPEHACASTAEPSILEQLPTSRSSEPSILGQIHLDLAKYHEIGRFVSAGGNFTGEYDRTAAWYHLDKAVQCKHLEAVILAADIYLGRSHDILTDLQADCTVEEGERRGVCLLLEAAGAGYRCSMLDVGRCYELGTYLTPPSHSDDGAPRLNWQRAVYWYEKALDCGDYQCSADDPSYMLLGRCAEMYMQGGPSLASDPAKAADMFGRAAELAAAAMKGRTANKYFTLAEECNALCDQ